MCNRQGCYSGGLAVVAANTKEEAFATFFADTDYDWMVCKIDPITHKWTDDASKWKTDIYPLEYWFECKVLTANVKKPRVIMEDGYSK